LSDHNERDGLSAIKDPFEVDGDDQVEIFFGHLFDELAVFHPDEEGVAGDAGVVDEDVDAAVLGDDGVYPLLHGGAVGDVEVGKGGAQGGGRGPACGGIDVAEGDGGALGDEFLGRGAADAGRGASDETDFIVQTHAVLLCRSAAPGSGRVDFHDAWFYPAPGAPSLLYHKMVTGEVQEGEK
ncbi:MAG TPA: hypothetical protein VE175_08805, partial [Woeseiaceae bacterium]|nr:hypothetical protein [Woeseiaceae bacterium]